MKLITLNTWAGIVFEPLKEFIGEHAKDTDVFCFQETRNGASEGGDDKEFENLFEEIENVLTDFKGYYTEMLPGFGISIFVRKGLEVEKFESHIILSSEELKDVKIFNGKKPHPRVLQVVTLKSGVSIVNFHGVPGDLKKDTKERELQTNRLQAVLANLDNSKILVGDFNLNPDTKAISEIGKQMRNLIKESDFKTTRSSLYEKREIMPFADYVFVSPDIAVKNFQVLQDEVSDHLPLLLEF